MVCVERICNFDVVWRERTSERLPLNIADPARVAGTAYVDMLEDLIRASSLLLVFPESFSCFRQWIIL